MEAVKFKHHNVVFAENQKEYKPIPALRIAGPGGHVISCWRLSLWERIKVLFLGRVWMDLMSYNQPLTPSHLSVNRKDMYIHPDDNKRFNLSLKISKIRFKTERLIRTIELKFRYANWALSKIDELHLTDKVRYDGIYCTIISGASKPFWKLWPVHNKGLNKSKKKELERVHEKHFEPILNLETYLNRFQMDYDFQINNWFKIDVNRPIGTRISYKSSNDIQFSKV